MLYQRKTKYSFIGSFQSSLYFQEGYLNQRNTCFFSMCKKEIIQNNNEEEKKKKMLILKKKITICLII